MDIDVLASEAQALRFELAVPIVSIASVQNARVESSVRFGSSGSPSPVFEAASLTKPVFAAAVLQLGASGAIDLDRPLCEYPGGQPPVADERAQRITARLVLSHRSGLPNWVASDADQLIADPGTGFSYSGEAHNYLQRVVEALVGERLDACVERLVLEPARMSMSTMSWSPSLEAVFAGPHDALGQPVARRDQPLMAAGSQFTTAEDYARFLTFLLRREGLLASMLQAQTKVTDSLGWGLGWGLSGGYVFYWGDNPGFKHLAVLHRAEGSGLVVLTNSDSGWRRHLGLADLGFPSASFVTWLTELYG